MATDASGERIDMRFEGIHHVTAITADAVANVTFYVDVMGLRLVKRTVNFDDPTAYHLYYGDEHGTPGSILTFFEYPGAGPGRAGDGMLQAIEWRVGGPASLVFWQARLADHGLDSDLAGEALAFADPEGLAHVLRVDESGEPALSPTATTIPDAHALRGLGGVRAYAANPAGSTPLLRDVLGFEPVAGDGFRVAGAVRSGAYGYEPPPVAVGRSGAGTIHHVAFASTEAEHVTWLDRLSANGIGSSGILDRTYFRSIYFREPSGVLFEIATVGPGFAVDESSDALGEALRLPPQHEHLRGRLETSLRPLTTARA